MKRTSEQKIDNPIIGDLLDKSQVMASLLIKLDKAFKNPNNNYEELRKFFELSFDMRITYCPKTKLFRVWEEENYN